MKLTNNLFKKVLLTALIFQSSFLAYILLFNNYFQQDEWHGFGIMLSLRNTYVTFGKNIFELILGDRVGARLIMFELFNFFKLSPFPYGLFALSLQLFNSYLVFLLTKKLTKQKYVSLFATFLFLVNEVGNEAYSWFGTMTGSLTSTTFFLLSLLLFIQFIQTKKIKLSIISAVLLWASFLFKEVGAFAFIFYPIIYLIYSSKREIKSFIRGYIPFILLGTVMLTFLARTILFLPGDKANYVSTGGSFLPNLGLHLIQYPLEGIVQLAIPNTYLFWVSNILSTVAKPDLSPIEVMIISQNYTTELLIILLTVICVLLVLFFRKTIKQLPAVTVKALIFSLLLASLSFLPYIVINRGFSYFESRYYYLGTVGISIFLSILVSQLATSKRKGIRIAIISFSILYILAHELILISDFNLIVERSNERQSFLKQIDTLVPKLNNNSIFFIQGNSIGYYGLPKLKVPFQSGLGQVLMVNYAVKKQLNPKFFYAGKNPNLLESVFLYDIFDQGYAQIGNQTFGYYYDSAEIKNALSKNLFSRNDIIPLYYESGEKSLVRQDLNSLLEK